jgi:hypothetical protein
VNKCPKCGGPGGVLLFNLVHPCDSCFGAKAGRRWLLLRMPHPLPPGKILGWNASTCGENMESYTRLPIPVGDLPEAGIHNVDIGGGEILMSPESMSNDMYKQFFKDGMYVVFLLEDR